MKAPLSPVITNLFMGYHENKNLILKRVLQFYFISDMYLIFFVLLKVKQMSSIFSLFLMNKILTLNLQSQKKKQSTFNFRYFSVYTKVNIPGD